MNPTITPNPGKAFMRGLRELKVKDLPEFREALKTVLGVGTMQAVRNYSKGVVQNLDVEKARQVEVLFLKYGVSNPWGL